MAGVFLTFGLVTQDSSLIEGEVLYLFHSFFHGCNTIAVYLGTFTQKEFMLIRENQTLKKNIFYNF